MMRERRRDVMLLALVTLAIGACWAGLAPAFHETDEPVHFGYVQTLGELGHPPREIHDMWGMSEEIGCWATLLSFDRVRWNHAGRPPWQPAQRRAAERTCGDASREHDAAQYHTFQPPAYYLLATPLYEAGSSAPLPTRLLLVRLLSVALAALTVALTYLLVRELVPGSAWAARAGALALAFQPVFMFNEAGVNPDALLVAISAAITLVIARAWRRGLTARRALVLGALAGLGVLTKANFLLLVPSVVLAAGALWWTNDEGDRRSRALRLAGGAAVALTIVGLYVLVNDLVWDRTTTFRQAAYSADGGNAGRLLSHAWQFFLPGLPSMEFDLTPGRPPIWTGLFEGMAGRLGWWNDFGLSDGWETLALAGAAAIVVGAFVYVVPRARRRPWPCAITALCALGFLAALVVADYQYALGTGASGFERRYVLPLMPLWGVVVGCCAAAFRPRWRPVLAAVLLTAFVAHTVVALAAMVNRYYL
jgi:4-amino-4-deoxy-L-arabinose transferase-like glycosyltransferase